MEEEIIVYLISLLGLCGGMLQAFSQHGQSLFQNRFIRFHSTEADGLQMCDCRYAVRDN